MANNNMKMSYIYKSVDWGGAASDGRGPSNALSSLRESYSRLVDGEM